MAKTLRKRCTACGILKPLAAFPLDKRYGKRRSWCNRCCNAYGRAWRRKNLARARARDRRYWRKYKAYRAAYERRPDVRRKRAVRQAVYWAVRTGLIPKKTACERCGVAASATVRLHAHHADYDRPLAVVWLCTLCHGDVHRLTRARQRLAGARDAPTKVGG